MDRDDRANQPRQGGQPAAFPAFRPHALLKSGHAQTIAAAFLHGAKEHRLLGQQRPAVRHGVRLSDGDQVVLHDGCPAGWRAGDMAVLLLHGLSGCGQSTYVLRAAARLNQVGVRTYRMDSRTCGAGRGLAVRPYHAGQSDDLCAALAFVAECCPGSPLGLVGYSMGGNTVLKALGEDVATLPETLVRAVAVNPAIDLAACCNYLQGPMQRFYDRHFAKTLTQHIAGLDLETGDDIIAAAARELQSSPAACIREFDQRFTVPRWGFDSVEHYYAAASSARFIKQIEVPTLILHSRDDPLIPAAIFENLERSDAVTLYLSEHGGHLGFVGAAGVDPDRRWMDWRIRDWLTGRVGPADVPAAPQIPPRLPSRRPVTRPR